MSDVSPTPVILDTSVVTAIARADSGIIGFVQIYDARSQPLVVPALAVAGASLDARSEDAGDLLAGLELLKTVTVAPLSAAGQAARLAAIMASTGLDAWDAHVAAVADAAGCPILTLDVARWRQVSNAFDEPLQIIEIADPGDGLTSSGGAHKRRLADTAGERSRCRQLPRPESRETSSGSCD